MFVGWKTLCFPKKRNYIEIMIEITLISTKRFATKKNENKPSDLSYLCGALWISIENYHYEEKKSFFFLSKC